MATETPAITGYYIPFPMIFNTTAFLPTQEHIRYIYLWINDEISMLMQSKVLARDLA
jgi:hypothetical protein